MTSLNIQIKNATVCYANTPVFANLTLQIKAGSWVALIGPSGVGKSTLLRAIAGLIDDKETFSGNISADNDRPVAEQIAYMAQKDALLPWLTVIDNVVLSGKLRGDNRSARAQLKTLADKLLQEVGLSAARHLYPAQLSGGMRQRVSLVRTFLENKPIVLIDEPFSALDVITRYQLQNLAANLLREKTVLFITHDPNEALRLANQIYLMHGSPAQLKLVTEINSVMPRETNTPVMLKYQNALFAELIQVAEIR